MLSRVLGAGRASSPLVRCVGALSVDHCRTIKTTRKGDEPEYIRKEGHRWNGRLVKKMTDRQKFTRMMRRGELNWNDQKDRKIIGKWRERLRTQPKEEHPHKTRRIFQYDNVILVAGPEYGKTGQVLKIDYERNTILVKGCNIGEVTEYSSTKGEYTETKERPMDYSWVNLVDPADGKACQTSFKYLENGSELDKVRVSKRSGKRIDYPIIPEDERTDGDGFELFPFNSKTDTDPDVVLQATYEGR
uniref:Large ribosomal subunit protein uL24c n=1 Tax=Mucochytrium quahogii TaxID=96639 RepID=A0A7S2R6V2_9STRA|mmetsp:Transcript_13822/g.22553  ORF Transcript_13822/g.22553 Transcript_13822/m.22553 type:complete len:246 (+) Transcript_13822:60-797(+)